MRILVDENVPLAEAFFGELGEVTRQPGREMTAASVRDHDALVVRSITPVNAALVAGSRLKFVGTCTIGTDHVELAALREQGIGFANAPGCNAEAVVDYVLSSLLLLCERDGEDLFAKTVGIVGAGNVGGRLAARLAALGISHLICDPPRAEAEGDAGFVALDTLIARADVICLHTPLVAAGAHATRHLLDRQRIAALTPGTVLLNAGRGDCLDGGALNERLARDADLRCVLDVWEHEPGIDEALYTRVDLATPHIAGHSVDGKLRGTEMIYQALSRQLGLPARQSLARLTPTPWLSRLVLDAATPRDDALRLCARACYDPRRDAMGLERYRRRLGMAQGFDAYRRDYPVRREFQTHEVALTAAAPELAAALRGFGFRVTTPAD